MIEMAKELEAREIVDLLNRQTTMADTNVSMNYLIGLAGFSRSIIIECSWLMNMVLGLAHFSFPGGRAGAETNNVYS